MPLYSYKREDGTVFDILQGMYDERLTVCPDTGQKVTRVFYSPQLVTTDTRRKYINIRKRAAHNENFYTSLPEYKEKTEKYMDENKIPKYKKNADSKPIFSSGT